MNKFIAVLFSGVALVAVNHVQAEHSVTSNAAPAAQIAAKRPQLSPAAELAAADDLVTQLDFLTDRMIRDWSYNRKGREETLRSGKFKSILAEEADKTVKKLKEKIEVTSQTMLRLNERMDAILKSWGNDINVLDLKKMVANENRLIAAWNKNEEPRSLTKDPKQIALIDARSEKISTEYWHTHQLTRLKRQALFAGLEEPYEQLERHLGDLKALLDGGQTSRGSEVEGWAPLKAQLTKEFPPAPVTAEVGADFNFP